MRIGFRTWTLIERGEVFDFRSVAYGYAWELMGANQARNYHGSGYLGLINPDTASYECSWPIPLQNTVGLYHYYDADKAEREYPTHGLLGACMCWGRMAGKDGERMFRSEYSQIVAITEPRWSEMSRPHQPILPYSLASRLWMAAVTKERADLLSNPGNFKRYAESLAQVLGIDFRSVDTEAMFEQCQSKRVAVDQGYVGYVKALEAWTEKMRTWDEEHSARLRAKVPFPVFQSIPELVSYAQKFGDLGPPSRDLAAR